MNASPATESISTAYLSWINEQLRQEIAHRDQLASLEVDQRSDRRAILGSYLFAGASMISLAAMGAFSQ